MKDCGSGIPLDEREAIFQPFKRSKATKETIPGVGLGLFTARRIVQAHGGRIELESEFGRGSTFFVYLPPFGLRNDAINGATIEAADQKVAARIAPKRRDVECESAQCRDL